MNRMALISLELSVFLSAGALLAQSPNTPTQNAVERAANAMTPENILSIRDIRELQLSPDGKQIAFVIREPVDAKLPRQPRASNIWIVPSDGSQRPRPMVPNLKHAYSPLWSPDGRTVAFLSDRGVDVTDSAGQGDQVYLLRVDGGDAAMVERLTSVPGGVEGFAWSPDGKMIAFVAGDQATPEEQRREAAGYDAIEVDHNYRYNRLWVTNLSDRKAVQVTKQDFEINEIAWSPKGDELALDIATTPDDSVHLSLVVVNRLTLDTWHQGRWRARWPGL